MEAQNNDPSWANQMEVENFQLSYTTPKERVSNVQNEANSSNDMSPPCVEGVDISNQNLNQPHSFELLSISYSELQPANPDL